MLVEDTTDPPTPPPTAMVCVGEIDSKMMDCVGKADNQEDCESIGKSIFSDGVCDWVEESEFTPCADVTRGNKCRARSDCWYSNGTCKDLVCEVATNRRLCMKVFPQRGLTCRYVNDTCMTFDPKVCITLTRKECSTSQYCEYDWKNKACVDKGSIPCVDYKHLGPCNRAEPVDYPPGCKFDKVTKTCANIACSSITRRPGCTRVGCHWDGSTCADPAGGF